MYARHPEEDAKRLTAAAAVAPQKLTLAPSGVDAADLRTFQRQIVHQSRWVEHEPDDGACDLVGIDQAPAPSVIKVTEPSTPTFQPAVRLKPASAEGVMNMMMTVRACAPSWKPNDAETRL